MSSEATFSSISVLGGGAWGTALAALAARNGVSTVLWTRNDHVCGSIAGNRENSEYLPGIALPDTLIATDDLALALTAQALIIAIPAQHCRAMYERIVAMATVSSAPFVAISSKGIERGSLMLVHEVLRDVWPAANPAIISGPSFAHDVATGKPTAVTLAAGDEAAGMKWCKTLGTRNFRPYRNDDLTGVALGGAVKNVLAIAAGIVRGLDLGESAHAALIARGFAEFQRLGESMGASQQTMTGLSGLGDLILTAGSDRSRNMSLGIALGRGQSLDAILAARNSVSEGVASAQAVNALAQRHAVDMPVCAAVDDIVAGRQTVRKTINMLMDRPLRTES